MTTLRVAPGRPAQVRQLDDAHRSHLDALVDADPYVHAVLAARLSATRTLDAGRLGGALLGVHDGANLHAAVFSGGNLLPIGGDDAAWEALAGFVSERRRVCTSIIGRADAVGVMWRVLEPVWGPARTIRRRQPLLSVGKDRPTVAGDARVRAIRPGEIEQYLPAAVAMFTEELEASPFASVSAAAYRRRASGLIGARRVFGLLDADRNVIFKADIGAVSAHTCQLQGVWVRPDLRGRGIGTAALSSVIDHGLTLAPTVSLYVNDYNAAARHVYQRLGMRPVATLSTVLF